MMVVGHIRWSCILWVVLPAMLMGDHALAQRGADQLRIDTSQAGQLLHRADLAIALWQLDTVSHYAELALARIRPWTEDQELMRDPAVRRALLRYKARCLGLLGRATRDINDLGDLEEALSIYEDLGDVHSQARTHHHFSERLSTMGEPLEGIEHLRTGIDLMERIGDTGTAAHWLNSLGVRYRVMGQPSTALEYHLRVLPELEAIGDSSGVAFTYILIGAVHRSTRQWPGAIHHFHIARRKYRELGDTMGLSMAYNDLGTAWYGAGNMDSAMHYHRMAADLRSHTDYFHGLAYSHQFMAQIHHREKRYDQAIEEYLIAAGYFQQVPTYSQVAAVHGHIAQIHKERGDADAALRTITEALEMLQHFKEAQFAGHLYDQAGGIHAYRGEFAQAERAYLNALEIAQASNDLSMEMTVNGHLSKLYEDQGDMRRAYERHRVHLATRDSLRGRSGRSEVLRMMLQHNADQAKREKERRDEARRLERQAELASRKRQQRFYLSGGGLLAVLAIGLVGRMQFSARSKRKLEDQRRDLESAKQRAEQSERFKERFLANMSHEIRTPMNAIMGMTAIMRRGTQLPHQRVYLDAIAQSADNLLGIINDILDLSKLDAERLELELTPMDPAVIVRGLVQELGPKARDKGLELNVDLHKELPTTVNGDPTRLRQLLMNLAENAVKYTTAGHVTISARPARIEFGGPAIRFTVADTGPGIPPERLETIFEEFNKAYAYSEGHGRYGGTGLGLAISKRLAELHGGTLTVESRPGAGSTFTATIPYTSAEQEQMQPSSPEEERPLTGLHILIADDNEFNLMVATDELMDAIPGVRVDVARNGREAVERVLGSSYDVVLMDVQMPEMNGYDATRAIREAQERTPGVRTPILAMTANALGTEVVRCREAGMDGFVPKPFRREDLLAELRTLLNPDTGT